MPMRGLTIIVAGVDPERLRTALTLLASQAALGGRSRLFVDGAGVGLFRPPITVSGDDGYAAAGLPRLRELLDTALELGARVILCQSGLALAALEAASIDPRLEFGGMAGIIATLGDDRLVGL